MQVRSSKRKLHLVKTMKRSKFDSVKWILLCIRKVCMIRFWLTFLLAQRKSTLYNNWFWTIEKVEETTFLSVIGYGSEYATTLRAKINGSTNAFTSKNIFDVNPSKKNVFFYVVKSFISFPNSLYKRKILYCWEWKTLSSLNCYALTVKC